jgi:enoyl-CoA hydratase
VVVDAALEIAEQIAGNSPFGVWMTKEVMWSNLETASLHAGIDLENRTQILTSFSEDMPEAMTAFLAKRPPVFRNR